MIIYFINIKILDIMFTINFFIFNLVILIIIMINLKDLVLLSKILRFLDINMNYKFLKTFFQ